MARILVIDDEKNIRKMVRLTLEHSGHTVETADDGPQGLEMFGDGQGWELALVDQRMPGMEGREVIREARRRDPHASLLMMTAFATTDLASEAVSVGAVDFLRKPFSAEMLRGAVNAVLEREHREHLDLTNLAHFEFADTRAQVSSSRVSFFLNGFTYYHAPAQDSASRVPEGFDVYRVFSVLAPQGKMRIVIVGIAPHVRMQLREDGRDIPTQDSLWDVVCGLALGDYLWQRAEMPPVFLPVYSLTDNQTDAVWQMKGHGPAVTF